MIVRRGWWEDENHNKSQASQPFVDVDDVRCPAQLNTSSIIHRWTLPIVVIYLFNSSHIPFPFPSPRGDWWLTGLGTELSWTELDAVFILIRSSRYNLPSPSIDPIAFHDIVIIIIITAKKKSRIRSARVKEMEINQSIINFLSIRFRPIQSRAVWWCIN